jgi:hypothetical protein
MKYFTVNVNKLLIIQVKLLLNSDVKFTEHLSIFTVQLNNTTQKKSSRFSDLNG